MRLHRLLGSRVTLHRYRRVISEHESFYTLLRLKILSGCARNFIAFQKTIRQGRGPSHRVP